ncbi:hypothetical protein MJO28_002697 [Puccinia striiformis f. sp. tritici]|uniref:Uncharacterized protein n=1 Tax=Puccinia striiformis f. sp. tritici TaxID=168172 RepID=A0ACC0ESP4_9BASI|nr:hypothetical protein MJO28_002697 [Puccinia striiformis f. sp. tritici]
MPLRMADSDSDHRQPPTPGRNNRAKLQLLILCLIRLCEPISFTVIFPMVAFMVAEFNPTHSDKQVGFYCGAIESIFSLAQFSTIILWGKLSDRIGRKPVLLIGLIGVSISTLAFGFSSSFWTMILARSIGGVLNGNTAIGYWTLTWRLLVSTSREVSKFLFSTSQFWQSHPWLLPCAVAAIAPLLEFVMATLWLNETLPNKKSTNTEREPLLQSLADIDVQESLVPPGPSPTKILDLLKDRNLLVILISYSLLSFQHISLEALIVLFASTPIKSGGIGFSSADIGLALSLSGVMVIFVQLGLFPFFQKRFGTARLYKVCMSAYPLIFILFPIIHFIARSEDKNQQEGGSSFTGVPQPTWDVLATINGMAQSCGSFVRAIGPITASSLFAFSVLHQNFIDGNSVFLLFACIALGAFLNSLNIKDGLEQWRNT